MKIFKVIVIVLMIVSCSQDDDSVITEDSLLSYMFDKNTETGAVIACSATDPISNEILTFFYPESNEGSFRFYKTESAAIEIKLDFSKYHQLDMESTPFFNGYLRKYTSASVAEHWIIITHEWNGELKISNPIRTKQLEKPTVWNDAVTINQDELLMPEFNWQLNALGDNAIYFQIISEENDELISGTYTYENSFQFYDTTNVVLNITEGIPQLQNSALYNFTLMDVSLDNWVNLVSQKSFITR